MSPKDTALSKMQAPGKAVTGLPPASVSIGCAMPSSGGAPVPISPFSDWKNTLMPSGRYLATRVGMPMPRLISIPGLSSRAMRRAMMVCGSMAYSRIGYEVVDNRRWRHDVVGGDYTDWHNVIGAGDDG